MAAEGVPGEAEALQAVAALSSAAFGYLSALHSAQQWAEFKGKAAGLRARGGAAGSWRLVPTGNGWDGRVMAALESVPFFSGLLKGEYKAAVDSMARQLEVRQFRAGEPIVAAGEPADGLYMLLSGTADVEVAKDSDVAVVAKLEAGQSFGEQAMIDEHKKHQSGSSSGAPVRNATIRSSGSGVAGSTAEEDVTVCLRLGLADFHRLPAKAVGLG